MAIEASVESTAPVTSPAEGGDQDLLFAVAARLRRLSENVLRELDVPLTFRQYRTLARVAAGYGSMSHLAARANLTLPTVSGTVDGLVRRGLIDSLPSPTDGRATLLRVTEAGAAATVAGDIALDAALSELTRGLSEEASHALDASLRVVYDAATEYMANYFPRKT